MKKKDGIIFRENMPMLSQEFELGMLTEDSKKDFQDISRLISKKIIKRGLNDVLCQLICEVTYCIYVYMKNQNIEYGFEKFQKTLGKNLSFICVGFKIMSNNGKSEGRIIFINPKIVSFPKKFLLVFTHELIHTISAGRYSTGLIRNYKFFRHKNLKYINDHFTAFNRFWYLNEVQTEYIAVASLSVYFDLDENEYGFYLSDGLKVRIFSKCFSYKDFFVYIGVINYIYKNQLIKAYLEQDFDCEEVIYDNEFVCFREVFLDFYNEYCQYVNTFENYEKETEKHSCIKFKILTKKFILLVEKFLEKKMKEVEMN